MDSNEITKRRILFDDCAHEENGVEFWYARDIMEPLGYKQWCRFEDAIKRAEVSCETSGRPAREHFAGAGKMVQLGNGSSRKITDYKLTRYACYLIAQNGDPLKRTSRN